ncbi:methyltransferase family protein [Noviherbaspirillum sp.]|uniref:methyltransferase family protein n=1 Tax=Noviherbaspirillum sp. TaxID=1926288 RepID=UPI002D6CCE8D|nr:methyltransferase [Noviherbaspirillum sp.]HZW19692.1 methyltransferase [Noviherbaspirillum sp.]
MSRLELKIPPVLLVFLFAGLMALLSSAVEDRWQASTGTHALAALLALAGALVAAAGVLQFRRAKTTVNPVNPGSSSSLVSSGVYRVTRNPMYLGFLLLLAAWAFYLASLAAAALLPLFVLYMNRFQIVPEERVLARLFGREFDAYRGRVRRWI